MALSKRELQDMATQIEQGKYIKKTSAYTIAAIMLAVGLYIGNLVATLYAPVQQGVSNQQAAPQQSPSSGINDIPPQTLRAILNLEKQVQNSPKDLDSWTRLAHFYFDTNQHKKAIKAYTTVLSLKSDQPDVLVDLGVMYRRDQQHSKAIEMFNKAISINPKHEVAHFNKGIVLYYDLAKKDEAIGVWKKLLLINPSAKAPNGTPISEMLKQL